MRPTSGASTPLAIAVGAVSSAERIGESPHTDWAKNISGRIIAVAANPIVATPRVARLKSRSAKMRSGISGSPVLTA